MIVNKETLLSTFQILISRHEKVIDNFLSLENPSQQDLVEYRRSLSALETYVQSRFDIVNSWSQ